jgi:hypothetical protein
LRPSECFLSFRPSNQNFVRFSHLPHARYMPRPSDPPCFDNPNNMLKRTNYAALIAHFSLPSCYFIPLRSSFAHCSWTRSVCVLPVTSETRFHTKTGKIIVLF